LTNDGTSQGGSGSFNYLNGGIGSGVSYDFAFRTFINGGEGGAIQMFFDLTAMEELYNSGGSHYITYGWTNGPGSIGAIGNHFNISLYNADAGHLNANQVTFGIVPEPSSLALVTLGLLCVAAAGGSAQTPRDSDAGASAAVGSDLRADPGTQTARARRCRWPPGCVDFRERPGPTQLAEPGGLLALPAGGKRYEPGEEVEVVLRD